MTTDSGSVTSKVTQHSTDTSLSVNKTSVLGRIFEILFFPITFIISLLASLFSSSENVKPLSIDRVQDMPQVIDGIILELRGRKEDVQSVCAKNTIPGFHSDSDLPKDYAKLTPEIKANFQSYCSMKMHDKTRTSKLVTSKEMLAFFKDLEKNGNKVSKVIFDTPTKLLVKICREPVNRACIMQLIDLAKKKVPVNFQDDMYKHWFNNLPEEVRGFITKQMSSKQITNAQLLAIYKSLLGLK